MAQDLNSNLFVPDSYKLIPYHTHINAVDFDSIVVDANTLVEMQNGYPVPGSLGFGAGVAPEALVTQFNLIPMEGYNNPASLNFGNYLDITGSQLVFIPKYYVKKTYEPDTAPSVTQGIDLSDEAESKRTYPFKAPYWGQKIEMSRTPKTDFTLPLCFKNAGKEIDGIFMDKYFNSANGQKVPVSKRYGVGLSTKAGTNSIGEAIKNCSTHNYQEVYLAVKQRGNNYSIPHLSLYVFLLEMGLAHLQALYEKNGKSFDKIPKILCSYANRGWHFICGHSGKNNHLTCSYNTDITFQHAGLNYNLSLIGSEQDEFFADCCHNGQKCGVEGILGNYWEITGGNLGINFNTLSYLKESIDIKSITKENVNTTTNYTAVTLPAYFPKEHINYSNSKWYSFATGTNNYARLSSQWIFNDLGIKTHNNTNTKNAYNNLFQNYWKQNTASNQIIFGGSCLNFNSIHIKNSSLCSLHLDSSLAYSSVYVGFRSCLVP